jgi:hypothetical protein
VDWRSGVLVARARNVREVVENEVIDGLSDPALTVDEKRSEARESTPAF